ncbi:MAG: ATP-binding protein [Pseudomonadota bacterium]
MTDTAPEMPTLAYRWRHSTLLPITHVQAVRLDDLLGIERQKAALVQNVQQFVHGRPSNHVLLTGSRGTGKSSLVKALLTRFAAEGLRVVEVHPQDLIDLPDVVAPLRERDERFLLYVDDFSVANNDRALTALKTALDGGIEAPAENVLIVATSNRRYLIPTMKADNNEFHWEDGELQAGESTEEKVSLSERFGLWLSFPPFSQDQYLDAVRLHLKLLGSAQWSDELQVLALRWALNRASRSARVARQFAQDHAGRQSG